MTIRKRKKKRIGKSRFHLPTTSHKKSVILKPKRPTAKSCDELWSKAVKLKADGVCEKCGKDTGVQSHHIVPRTCWSLRFDIENGVALCIRHHLYWAHKDAMDFLNWIKTKRNIDYLELKRHNTSKNDYFAISLYLKQEINELSS